VTRRSLRLLVLCGGIVAMLILSTQVGRTHTPIRSKYTYNDDVFPILQARCASCHVPGGVAPMSLMTYRDAVPWAESLRIELISGHMPPWYAEQGFGAFKNPHVLSGRELDVLLVWASGGTPRGDAAKAPPAVTLKNEWALGAPDLALQMPAPFTLAAEALEATQEFTLKTGTTTDRWVRAVDLLPGTPAIVREAIVSIAAPEKAANVLAVWQPGTAPTPTADGTAFLVPAGAELKLKVRYKKTWKYEGTEMTDQSTVGLYFTDKAPERPMQSVAIASGDIAPAKDQKVTFSHVLNADVQALALRPHTEQPDVNLQVEALKPDGARVPLIRLTGRPNWDRRYWFDRPVSLPRGTKIEVIATFQEPMDETLGAMAGMAPPAAPSAAPAAAAAKHHNGPLRLTLDVVAAKGKATATGAR
jgi:hypothetical protein